MPHKCQKAGWWLLLVWLVSVILFLTAQSIGGNVADSIETGVADYLWLFLGTCLPYIAVLLICVSKEKTEDEFINHLRIRSLLWVVAFAFVVGMLSLSLNYSLVRLGTVHQVGMVSMWVNLATNPLTLAVVYLLLFKGSVFINGLKSRNYE